MGESWIQGCKNGCWAKVRKVSTSICEVAEQSSEEQGKEATRKERRVLEKMGWVQTSFLDLSRDVWRAVQMVPERLFWQVGTG